MFYEKIKRIIDLTFSLFALIILFPFMIIVSIFLFIFNDKKIFFIQDRTGLNGSTFKLIKFKSMNDRTDINGKLLPDNLRLTKLGKFLRNNSIDELPQLINVIKGNISLVGPRPLLPEYFVLYNDFQKRRLEVKPGITGWAQINGRNNTTWENRFKYDIWYVDNKSLFLDIKILILTIYKVFKKDGINSDNSTTMKKFTGNKNL